MTDASDIDNLPPLRDVIREHDLRAEKSLGQNFLLDLNLTKKIAKGAGDLANATVFEIGPGPGGLTRAILSSGAKKLIAVEYDPRAIKALQSLKDASDGRLEIVQADALHVSLSDLAKEFGCEPPFVIIANLPYNIATPLLTGWLEEIHFNPSLYRELILMFQKEVAQRIVARPSTKAYGRISILTQWLCHAKMLFDVPGAAFTPPPKVTSSIVRFVPAGGVEGDFKTMEKLTAAAFGQRRKMIRSSLKDYMPYVEACGLRPEARAEELSPDDFAKLALAVSKGLL